MMKEPTRPYPPSSYEYEKKTERVYIYEFWENLNEDEDYDDQDDEEEKRVPVKDISKVDMAWLMSQVPEGVSPSQVKIEFGYNANCMAYEDHYVKFYYEVEVPARKAEYKAAKQKYEEENKLYEQKMVAYKAAVREQAIKDAEFKLARLKNQDVAINQTVEDSRFSVRTTRALTDAGITTLEQLTHKTQDDLLDFKGFGETALREVREKLRSLGLTLWNEDR